MQMIYTRVLLGFHRGFDYLMHVCSTREAHCNCNRRGRTGYCLIYIRLFFFFFFLNWLFFFLVILNWLFGHWSLQSSDVKKFLLKIYKFSVEDNKHEFLL
jgi:hypothetical protein